MSYAAHKLPDVDRTFARQKHPMRLTTGRVITSEEIKETARFLVTRQDQTFGGGVPSPAIGFDGNRLDVEENQPPTGGQILENPADVCQNCRSPRILTDQFALDPAKAKTVFLTIAATAPAQAI